VGFQQQKSEKMGCNGKNWGIPRENSPGIEMMRTEYGLFEEFSGSYRVHNLGVLLVHGPGRVAGTNCKFGEI
jgi:hypothetical protein